MKTKQLLTAGRALDRCLQAEARAREQRERFRKQCLEGACFWTSHTSSSNGITINVKLADYLASYPEAKPTLCEWEWEGTRRASMRYPEQHVGELRPGFHLWVQASTETVSVPAPKVEAAA